MNIPISLVGSLYVSGGSVRGDDRLVSQVDVVDVSSGETSRGPSMRHPRALHAAAAASTTSIFVFGGVDDSGLKSCEMLNPHTRQEVLHCKQIKSNRNLN